MSRGDVLSSVEAIERGNGRPVFEVDIRQARYWVALDEYDYEYLKGMPLDELLTDFSILGIAGYSKSEFYPAPEEFPILNAREFAETALQIHEKVWKMNAESEESDNFDQGLKSEQKEEYMRKSMIDNYVMPDVDSSSFEGKVLKYTFFSDPGHGWLRVPTKDMLEIMGDDFKLITRYSYTSRPKMNELPRYVYLEEDCDCSRFSHQVEAKGATLEIKVKNSNSESSIRGYNKFSVDYIKACLVDDDISKANTTLGSMGS